MLGLRERLAPVRPTSGAVLDRSIPGEEISPGLFLVEHRFHWPDAPGILRSPARDASLFPARRVLAFDTETTGLAGGSGTRAFMIGAADWHGGQVRVRQLCIATLAAESAMLRMFAQWLQPDTAADDVSAAQTVLVSYNGRSYDAPLLRTRYRLARLPEPLQHCAHVDLLHPTRRRYRGVWENCRLGTIERNLLGIVRDDDLPGAQAPGAWLQYLRGGDSALLQRVFAHNLQDVRTLLALLLRLQHSEGTDADTVVASAQPSVLSVLSTPKIAATAS